MPETDANTLASRIKAILDDRKAEDIQILDVRGISSVTDIIVMASGSSLPHIRAMHEDVRVRLKQEGMPCYRHSADPEGGWMVLDYVHVVVHLFLPDVRRYYDLESLWAATTPSADESVPPPAIPGLATAESPAPRSAKAGRRKP